MTHVEYRRTPTGPLETGELEAVVPRSAVFGDQAIADVVADVIARTLARVPEATPASDLGRADRGVIVELEPLGLAQKLLSVKLPTVDEDARRGGRTTTLQAKRRHAHAMR